MELILIGILIGLIAAYLLIRLVAQKQMFVENRCAIDDFDQAVAALEAAFTNSGQGWNVITQHMIHNSLSKHGYPTELRTCVMEMCNAKYASAILAASQNKKASAFLPCRISVYEMLTPDGVKDIYISRINSSILGKLMKGEMSRIICEVYKLGEELLKPLIIR